jgi:hypothetical protein
MKLFSKGTLVLLVLLALSVPAVVGAQILYDRAHEPRVWVLTRAATWHSAIQGNRVTLFLRVHAPDFVPGIYYAYKGAKLDVENNELVAHRSNEATGLALVGLPREAGPKRDFAVLYPPVTFFLPENAEQLRAQPGTADEIWAEVAVPKKGPPRPIQLALKRGTQWIPLTCR